MRLSAHHLRQQASCRRCIIAKHIIFFGTVPEKRGVFPPVTKPPFHAKKLQTGTVLPAFSALYREFAELPVCFALWAIQPAQKRVDVLYRLHESDFGLLIFYTNYAIL